MSTEAVDCSLEDDLQVAQELQRELASEEERLNYEAALKLQEAFQAEDRRVRNDAKLQSENDLLVSQLLQVELMQEELDRRKEQERKDYEKAMQLQQKEEEETLTAYVKDLNIARQLHFEEVPSYVEVLRSQTGDNVDTVTHLKSSFDYEKDFSRIQTGFSSVPESKRKTAEQLIREVTEVASTVDPDEIRHFAYVANSSKDKIQNLAARCFVYRNNAALRNGLELCKSGEEWGRKQHMGTYLPCFDLHGLTVTEANRRLYPFLELAKRYRWPRIELCIGIGRRSKDGRSKLFDMIQAVLSKLQLEPKYSARLVTEFSYHAGTFSIKVPLS